MIITKFIPPIEDKDTDELIAMAHSSTEHWQEEAIKQAKEELIRRNISEEYQNKVISEWEEEARKFQEEWQKQLEENATKRYSILQQLIIFLASPLILLGKIDYDQSVTDLKQENFKIKAKQRIIALIVGAIVYFLTFYILTKI